MGSHSITDSGSRLCFFPAGRCSGTLDFRMYCSLFFSGPCRVFRRLLIKITTAASVRSATVVLSGFRLSGTSAVRRTAVSRLRCYSISM